MSDTETFHVSCCKAIQLSKYQHTRLMAPISILILNCASGKHNLDTDDILTLRYCRIQYKEFIVETTHAGRKKHFMLTPCQTKLLTGFRVVFVA